MIQKLSLLTNLQSEPYASHLCSHITMREIRVCSVHYSSSWPLSSFCDTPNSSYLNSGPSVLMTLSGAHRASHQRGEELIGVSEYCSHHARLQQPFSQSDCCPSSQTDLSGGHLCAFRTSAPDQGTVSFQASTLCECENVGWKAQTRRLRIPVTNISTTLEILWAHRKAYAVGVRAQAGAEEVVRATYWNEGFLSVTDVIRAFLGDCACLCPSQMPLKLPLIFLQGN